EGGPGWSSGFARRSVGLFGVGLFDLGLFGLGLRLANDDLRAVEREIVELHAKALAVGMRPNGPDCLPVVALVFRGHGIDAMARWGGVLLAHAKSPFSFLLLGAAAAAPLAFAENGVCKPQAPSHGTRNARKLTSPPLFGGRQFSLSLWVEGACGALRAWPLSSSRGSGVIGQPACGRKSKQIRSRRCWLQSVTLRKNAAVGASLEDAGPTATPRPA